MRLTVFRLSNLSTVLTGAGGSGAGEGPAQSAPAEPVPGAGRSEVRLPAV